MKPYFGKPTSNSLFARAETMMSKPMTWSDKNIPAQVNKSRVVDNTCLLYANLPINGIKKYDYKIKAIRDEDIKEPIANGLTIYNFIVVTIKIKYFY